MREPACWEMRWSEVAVLDGNAAALGIQETSLMEAAGRALAETAREMTDGEVLVLCGPGNNGGDGFVAARYLREWGVGASVLASHAESRGASARAAREGAGEVRVWPDAPGAPHSLVVDCLLGAGASPGQSLRSPIGEVALWAAELRTPVLACDIPTGLGGPDALSADATLTFHSMKQGLTSWRKCPQGRPRSSLGDRWWTLSRCPDACRNGGSAYRLRPRARRDAERSRI